MDAGELDEWKNTPAPEEARIYYDLPDSATFRDVVLSVRADESMHREVNHHFADLGPDDHIEDEVTEVREMDSLNDKNKIEQVKV
jgi:ubiquinol oxidase